MEEAASDSDELVFIGISAGKKSKKSLKRDKKSQKGNKKKKDKKGEKGKKDKTRKHDKKKKDKKEKKVQSSSDLSEEVNTDDLKEDSDDSDVEEDEEREESRELSKKAPPPVEDAIAAAEAREEAWRRAQQEAADKIKRAEENKKKAEEMKKKGEEEAKLRKEIRKKLAEEAKIKAEKDAEAKKIAEAKAAREEAESKKEAEQAEWRRLVEEAKRYKALIRKQKAQQSEPKDYGGFDAQQAAEQSSGKRKRVDDTESEEDSDSDEEVSEDEEIKKKKAQAAAAAAAKAEEESLYAGPPPAEMPSRKQVPDMSKEDFVMNFVRYWLGRWQRDILDTKRKVESALLTEDMKKIFSAEWGLERTKDDLKPLMLHLKHGDLPERIRDPLEAFADVIADRNYVTANHQYVELVLGHKTWNNKCTLMRYHHNKGGRVYFVKQSELTDFDTSEEVNAYMYAMKRLLQLAEYLNPADSSSQILDEERLVKATNQMGSHLSGYKLGA